MLALLLCMLLIAAMPALAEVGDYDAIWSDVIGEPDVKLLDKSGIRNYCTENGTTSAIIGEESDGEFVWVKEESGGRSAWFGIDNSLGTFEDGSRFWVRWLNREQNPAEWKDAYDKLDADRKCSLSKDPWIFHIGVTAPDGTPYEELHQAVPLYVQIDDAWDAQKLHAAYLKEDTDELKIVAYTEKLVYPEGTDGFACLTLNHFSPYAIYEIANVDLPKTGDASRAGMWLVLLALSCAAGGVLLMRGRKME